VAPPAFIRLNVSSHRAFRGQRIAKDLVAARFFPPQVALYVVFNGVITRTKWLAFSGLSSLSQCHLLQDIFVYDFRMN
jgi:hypothetical protein